jgi:hypothetical protein
MEAPANVRSWRILLVRYGERETMAHRCRRELETRRQTTDLFARIAIKNRNGDYRAQAALVFFPLSRPAAMARTKKKRSRSGDVASRADRVAVDNKDTAATNLLSDVIIFVRAESGDASLW